MLSNERPLTRRSVELKQLAKKSWIRFIHRDLKKPVIDEFCCYKWQFNQLLGLSGNYSST